jgi:TonB family protein
MLLDQNPELQLRAARPKPLVISVLVHVLLIALLAINPDWFETTRRRTIRIAGEDFDLTRLELRQLTLPPPARRAVPAPQPAPAPSPVPAPQPPLVLPQQATPPPPPPPPPPNRVIRPDDLLAEGARPDGSPRASRGNTQEQARAGGSQDQQSQAQQAQEAQREQEARQAQQGTTQPSERRPGSNLPNRNPNALPAPSLRSSVGEIVEAQLDAARRNGTFGRTGIARGTNDGTFSTEPQILSPNPKGIDFGPYMNQLLNRLRSNWYSVMPEVARLGQRGRVDIVFTITRSGGVKDLNVVVHSGTDALDKGAISAIQLSNPFQQLPAEYETDLRLRIAFLYNMYP